MEETKNEEEKISMTGYVDCIFKTKLQEAFQISDDQFSLQTSMKTKELSNLINKILSEEQQIITNHKFNFLIQDQFVDGSIQKMLEKNELTTEQVLTITYTLGIPKPEKEAECPESDWIRKITPKRKGVASHKQDYVSGMFNGEISIYNSTTNEKIITKRNIHSNIINGLLFYKNTQTNKTNLISVSKDQTGNIFEYSSHKTTPEKKILKRIMEFSIEDEFECIALNPINNNMFVTGSSEGYIYIWNLEGENITNSELEAFPYKRKKLGVLKLESEGKYKCHGGNIRGAMFLDGGRLITGGDDHALKIWDLQGKGGLSDPIAAIFTNHRIITAFDSRAHILITAHDDATIKSWDLREHISGTKTHAKKVFKPHAVWVSDVEINPLNPYIFVSSGYDGIMKIWDQRSIKPLHTIIPDPEQNKIFSCVWNGPKNILCGGAGNSLFSYSIPFQQIIYI